MPRPLGVQWTLRQLPTAVLGLMGLTALVSILAALGARGGAPVMSEGLLIVPDLLRGQLWRPVTWVLYALGPISLIFACLTLYWFGADVARTLGRRGFLAFYFGLGAVAAAVTTLVALVSPTVASIPHAGCWPVLEGVVIAWGRMFADRKINFWGIPISGRHLVWITVGGIALFAAFYGVAFFVPHFAAAAAVLAWLGPIRRTLAARKRARTERAARGEAWSFDDWYQRDRRRRP